MDTASFQVGLNLVTLVMCVLTLTMATAALMPQLKQGLILLRDGLMWTLMLGVVLTVAFVGWSRLLEVQNGRDESSPPVGLQPFGSTKVKNASVERPSHLDPVVDYSIGNERHQHRTERPVLARQSSPVTSWESESWESRRVGRLEPVLRSPGTD